MRNQTVYEVGIIGSGFAGLGMAIRLRESGVEDFVVLERGGEVGGTWRDNTYPGAACDVPSRLYSFSFAPNADWSRSFSPQHEILDYLRSCSVRFGVRDKIRFDCPVDAARWDEGAGVWRLSTPDGEVAARSVVVAAGALSEPKLPEIPGLDRFAGKVFHTAAWDPAADLTGDRIAVIGTGASAIQVVPELQPKASRLDVYQRTAPWVLPRQDRRFTRLERLIARRLPVLQQAARQAIYWARELYVLGFTRFPAMMKLPTAIARRHLARQVTDPVLRAKLTPGYALGCKRVLISNDYFPALAQPNAEVVTSAISEIREGSVVTADGTERQTDAIVLATGFQVTPPPSGSWSPAAADAPSATSGVTAALRHTAGRPSPGSPTCSCSSGRTPASGTRRWSTSSSLRSPTCSAR